VAGPDWPAFSQFQLHVDVPEFVYAELDSMIRSPEGFSHSSFCVLPFYGMEYPAKTPCCLLPKSSSIDKIQQEMLQGQRPSACNKCWALEDVGLKSDRQIKNETLDLFTNVDLEQLIAECHRGKNKTVHYKIDTSNTCNSACMTCNGSSSNTWNKVLKKNNLPTYRNWKILPNQTTDWVDYVNAKLISFRGGEPFLSDTNFYILEQLIAHGNTDCFVSFVTNGSFSLSKHQKDILSKFPNLNFCFSIDGTGPVFEYVRWPLKWSDIENNVNWCREQNIDVSVSYTLSNINLFYHDETVKWFKDNRINYLANPVYDPAHFRPRSLPQSVKQHLIQYLNDKEVVAWLTHSREDDTRYTRFQAEVAKQDSMKNISIRDYLPELVGLLKW
jgi:sulfatase maturation enzyme AslB (radical SAM superfamily)